MNPWFSPWTRRDLKWGLLVLVFMMILQFPFTFFFDTILTNIGFLYPCFWAFPQATILYYVAFKLLVYWMATVIVGLMGIIGAPIDYYFEWVLQGNLIAPFYVLGYIPLFIIMGLSADVSLVKLHPKEKPLRASLVSSFIFTATVLLALIFATFFFYSVSHGGTLTLDVPWIKMGFFLIPYSLATGSLGGYLGFTIAKDIDADGEGILEVRIRTLDEQKE